MVNCCVLSCRTCRSDYRRYYDNITFHRTWSTVKSGASHLKVIVALTRVTTTTSSDCEKNSSTFMIGDLVNIQFKWASKCNEDVQEFIIKYTISRINMKNDSIIKANIVSEKLNFSEMGVGPPPRGWSKWIPMGSVKQTADKKTLLYQVIIDFSVTAYEVKLDVMSSILYFDTEFTDFNLSTEEGSVAVHKACLAGHSEVFKAMLRGEWKETREGQIQIKGANLRTLQQLKTYMYLGTLPDNNDATLRPLLLVARCYLLKDLEKHCIRKLAETVEPEGLFSLIDFACENQIPELPFTLLQLTKDSVIQKAHLIENEESEDDESTD